MILKILFLTRCHHIIIYNAQVLDYFQVKFVANSECMTHLTVCQARHINLRICNELLEKIIVTQRPPLMSGSGGGLKCKLYKRKDSDKLLSVYCFQIDPQL